MPKQELQPERPRDSDPQTENSRRIGFWRFLQQPGVSMLLLATAILFAGLGQGDIRIDGPIYAWAAKHMLVSGDWLNLYYDHGQTPYFNKPPLQFWLMAVVFKVLGTSTFSAKLVSVLFGLGCIAMVYVIARLRFEPAVAATAGMVLATTYTFVRNTAAVRLDAGVTFFFLVALYAGARLLLSREQRLGQWVILGGACGLALMIKSGGALLCLPILIAVFAWNRRWDLVWNWRMVIAFAVCATIVLPWYLHQYLTWGQAFVDQHFRSELVGRFESARFGSSGWYAYLLNVAKYYWPWLPLVIYGAYRLIRARNATDSLQTMDRLFIGWASVSLLLLHLLPRKYDRYLLLVYPVLAILAAYGLYHSAVWQRWRTIVVPHLGWAAALVLILLQLFHVQFHATGHPELAQALPAIRQAQLRAGMNRPAVYALGPVPISLQCNIRFFADAQVEQVEDSRIPDFRPGDIVVLPSVSQSKLDVQLPPHHALAQGRRAVFLSIKH